MQGKSVTDRQLQLIEVPESATLPETQHFTRGTMSRLSLKQAAEFASTTKPTILKHMAKGRVSGEKDDNGQWWFDMSELVRAYGEPSSRNTSGNTSLNKRNPLDLQAEAPTETVLATELSATRARLELVEQERERERRDKDTTIADLRARLDREAEERTRLTLLLTNQRSQPQAAPARGLWAWLRGGQ